MKELTRLSAILMAIAMVFFTSCKEDSVDVVVNPAEVLTQHMTETGMDLDHVLTSAAGKKFVIGAPVDGDLSAYHVIDIRSAADFSAGHINGAINVEFANILTEAANATKTIVVVCYTGQTACYATALLRLYGHQDAMALKWGMSGWSPTTDKWTAQIGDLAKGHANWTYDDAPARGVYDLPTFITTATTGEMILKERVEYVVSQGFKTVQAADVLAAPTNYFINNYFSEADYKAFGHITTSQRLLPLLIKPSEAGDATITNLDPSKKVVTYCYTGQTSAVLTACLRVMGYDAYSLTFGMNKLYNTNTAWTSNQWGGDSKSKDLPVVK